jgi:hypothetical protein
MILYFLKLAINQSPFRPPSTLTSKRENKSQKKEGGSICCALNKRWYVVRKKESFHLYVSIVTGHAGIRNYNIKGPQIVSRFTQHSHPRQRK